MITENDKFRIARLTESYLTREGISQNQLAKTLEVSSAIVSKIMTGGFTPNSPKEETWTQLAELVKYDFWKVVPMRQQQVKLAVFNAALELPGQMLYIKANAGYGKSHGLKEYVAANNKTKLLTIRENTNTAHLFYQQLAEITPCEHALYDNDPFLKFALGFKNAGIRLLIIDEASNLSGSALRNLKGLYRTIENYCSIVLLGTNALERAIQRGIKKDVSGYEELKSRIDQTIPLASPSIDDFESLCVANGVADEALIKELYDNVADFRQLRKQISLLKRAHSKGKPMNAETYNRYVNLSRLANA